MYVCVCVCAQYSVSFVTFRSISMGAHLSALSFPLQTARAVNCWPFRLLSTLARPASLSVLCVSVCVCERERENESGREREREREREMRKHKTLTGPASILSSVYSIETPVLASPFSKHLLRGIHKGQEVRGHRRGERKERRGKRGVSHLGTGAAPR